MKNERRLTNQAPLTAGEANHSVARRSSTSHGLPTAAAAWTTAYSPAGLRRRWVGVFRCPFCQGGHVIYGRDLDSLRGTKKANCRGGKVWIVIAHTVTSVGTVSDVAA